MLKKDLAQLLGISPAMVTRLSQRGMPTDTLERAQRWRKRHLEPSRVKGNRFDDNFRESRPIPVAVPVHPARAHAEMMLNAAAELLGSGATIDPLIPALRAALAGVPPSQRWLVALPAPVMDVLVHDVAAVLMATGSAPGADEPADAPECMGDKEAEEMGRFWFAVAAGEFVPTP
jgi:hypothetical protein